MADPLLRASLDLQSIGLLGNNLKFLKKKKKTGVDFANNAVTNITANELLRAEAAFL